MMLGALQNILPGLQLEVTIPDLETPNTDQSIIHTKGRPDLISAIINERQQQLDAVLHEISDQEIVLPQLVKKKGRITQSLNLHKGLGSALWRLPTEVLSHIFVYCLPEDEQFSPEPDLALMLLTRVCRRWREVAVGLPSLWCRLYMELDASDSLRAAFCYDSWLKRSRGCPLSLALDCHAIDSTKLRSLIQPYVHQISSLSIPDPDQPELLLNNLPALQELTIVGIDHRLPPIAPFISRLPSTLRSLRIKEAWFNVRDISSFNPVWAQLTKVDIDIVRSNVLLHLLELCPNLSSLTVRADYDGIPTLEPFTHTAIQSIDIYFFHYATLSGLFDALSLPNLRVLVASHARTWPHEKFKAFLVRSKCSLESLTVRAGLERMTHEQRAECVVLYPSLKINSGRNRSTVFRGACVSMTDGDHIFNRSFSSCQTDGNDGVYVYDLVHTLHGVVGCDIEIHLHNDTGMAITKAYCTLKAGATNIDTCQVHTTSPCCIAKTVEVNVPFMNPITGYCAFTPKAGIHAKAILNNPSTYENFKPEEFGLTRYVSIGLRSTGWNASSQESSSSSSKSPMIKELTDVCTQFMDDVDSMLRAYHSGIQSGELTVGQKEALDRLLQQHRESSRERVEPEAPAAI
ncbi:uncharacterized protein EDB91DRAFT_1079730 [Suillus paluster]|uniref:uncharacterized protein n=1 Tax=Suillus paluster TaxID=48578 RepID=UPI001B884CE9|nr:uncharacterized protein EDB91DRAFT_1079730 [Suillus paluster]KAG1747102.1 hypothetical protein EDB91DRAFT_1079730 [Suillus paluster]